MSPRRCRFPQKDQLTKAEAKARAVQLNVQRFDGRPVVAYRCPAGHHHVGHRRRLGGKRVQR